MEKTNMLKLKQKLVKGIVLGSAMLFLPITAQASEADFGAEILACFHPFGDFRSVNFGDPYRNNAYTAIDGTVSFKGIWTGNSYYMDFTILYREVYGNREFRVEPGVDTAPFPPDSDCRMRSWTEY